MTDFALVLIASGLFWIAAGLDEQRNQSGQIAGLIAVSLAVLGAVLLVYAVWP